MTSQRVNEEMELQSFDNGMPALEEVTGMRSPGQRNERARGTPSLAFGRLWRKYIAIDVPLEACRDHLALERTYLAYFRTASAFATFGVAVAQLFRLKDNSLRSPHETELVDYSKSVGSAMQAIAVFTILLGAFKWQRQQRRMAEHKIKAGGWEVWIVFGMLGLVSLQSFLYQ